MVAWLMKLLPLPSSVPHHYPTHPLPFCFFFWGGGGGGERVLEFYERKEDEINVPMTLGVFRDKNFTITSPTHFIVLTLPYSNFVEDPTSTSSSSPPHPHIITPPCRLPEACMSRYFIISVAIQRGSFGLDKVANVKWDEVQSC